MENRLKALLHSSVPHRSITVREFWTTAALFLFILLPLSAAQLVARQLPQEAVQMGPGIEESRSVAAPIPAPTGPQQRERAPAPTREKRRERTPEAGEEWFDQAWKYHQSDRFEEALESFLEAARLGYRPATSYYNVACGYSMLGENDAALEWLDRAIEEGFDSWKHIAGDSDLDPLRADPRFQSLRQRLALQADGELEEPDRVTATLELFDTMRTEPSSDSKAWARLGLDLLRLRQLNPAIEALETAVQLQPATSSTAMYNLACAHSIAGNLQASLGWLDRAVESGLDSNDKLRFDPDLNNLRNTVGFAAVLEKAEVLSLSEVRNWDDDDNWTSQQIWAPAIERYTGYLRRNPSSGRGWFNLGYAHHYSEQFENARPAFQEALRLGYRPSVSLYNIACGYARLGQTDLAFDYLEQAVEAGFSDWGHIKDDDDLRSLRSDSRFGTYLDRFVKHREHHTENKRHHEKQ